LGIGRKPTDIEVLNGVNTQRAEGKGKGAFDRRKYLAFRDVRRTEEGRLWREEQKRRRRDIKKDSRQGLNCLKEQGIHYVGGATSQENAFKTRDLISTYPQGLVLGC